MGGFVSVLLSFVKCADSVGLDLHPRKMMSKTESHFLMRLRVLTYILSRGEEGVIDQDGQTALGYGSQTYTPRRWELVNDGRIVNSLRTRKTQFNRRAVVWVGRKFASPAALALAEARSEFVTPDPDRLAALRIQRRTLYRELRAVNDAIRVLSEGVFPSDPGDTA